MTLLVRPSSPGNDGVIIDIIPERAGWKHVGCRVLRLEPGEQYVGGEPRRQFVW